MPLSTEKEIITYKLEQNEKKLHVIWIGKLPEGELENLKIWAQCYPDFEINIWTDSKHTLVPFFLKQIKLNNKVNGEYNFQEIASCQTDFYQNYHLKNPKKSFDENAKNFLLDKKWSTEEEINSWIEQAKEQLDKQFNQIAKYSEKKMQIRDVASEEKLFKGKKEYHDCYLWELEQDNAVSSASDILRYQILDKEGGVYLDTDVLPQLDFLKVCNKFEKLVSFLKEYGTFFINDFHIHNIIINELMRLSVFKQLDDKNKILDLNSRLEKKSNKKLNNEIILKIAQYFNNNINWKEFLEFRLDDTLLYEPTQCAISIIFENSNPTSKKFIIAPGFTISKRKSLFLEKLKNSIINTYKPIILKTDNETTIFLKEKFEDPKIGMRLTGPKAVLMNEDTAKTNTFHYDDQARKKYQNIYANLINQAVVIGVFNFESLNSLESHWLENTNQCKITEITIEENSKLNSTQIHSFDENNNTTCENFLKVKRQISDDEQQIASKKHKTLNVNNI